MASVLKPYSNLLNPGRFQLPVGGQITIDWGHSLANGLIGCFLPGLSGVDLTGNAPTLTYGSSSAVGITQEGIGISSTGASTVSAGLSCPAPALYKSWTVTNTQSLYWRGYIVSAQANSKLISINYDANSDVVPYTITYIGLDGGATHFNIAWNQGGTFSNNATTSVVTGFVDLLATFNDVGGQFVNFYVNGVNTFSGVGWGFNGPPISQANSSFTINFTYPGDGRPPNAICNAAYVWNRELSADDALALHLAPYDFLVPAEPEMTSVFIPFVPPAFTLMPQIVT